MADIVRELDGQRLTGGLGLIVVGSFLVLRVVGRGFVGWLRSDEGSAGGIGRGRPVARGDARRIGLRGIILGSRRTGERGEMPASSRIVRRNGLRRSACFVMR